MSDHPKWTKRRLGELVVNGDLSYGIVQPGSDVSGGVPIVRVKDLRDGHVDRRGVLRVEPSISDRHRRTVLEGGELLLSIVGTVGESAVVPTDMAGWNVARAIAVIRPVGVSAQWIQLCMQSVGIRQDITAMLNTTVQATLNLADLKQLSIPVPPQAEREAIVEVLGALDDKIAANRRLASGSTELAESLFELTMAREQVVWVAVRSIAETVLGGTPSRDISRYWTNGTVPWLNSGKANEARILEPSAYITEEALERSAAKLMPVGATLIALTGATLGQVARLETPASGNQSVVGIWSEDSQLNDWLHFAIRSQIPELLKRATGAAQQHVNKRDVDALEVPLVDGESLKVVAGKIGPLLHTAAVCDRENLALSATRDELLPYLMSGRIRVRDAEERVGEVA